METEIQTCGVCSIRYDTNDHTPRVLINCGHTLCSHCLEKILKTPSLQRCPFDSLVFNETQNSLEHFPMNVALLTLLEGKNQKVCQTHSEELTIFCFQDNVKICFDCALFGEHKGHNIKKIKELKAKGTKVKRDLEDNWINFEKNQLKQDQEVETLKNGFLNKIGNKFEEVKIILGAKELDCRKQMENLLKRNIESHDGSLLKKDVSKAIEEIAQACQKEENLAFLDEDFDSIISRLQPQVTKEGVSRLSQEASRMMDCLEAFLINQANSINNFDLSNKKDKLEQPKESEEHPRIKQLNGFEKMNTMFTLERFEKSLVIWIKHQNRIDRIVHLGASHLIERIKVTFEQYDSIFQNQADRDFLSYIFQNFSHYTSLKVEFKPLDLSIHHTLSLFNILFCRIQHLKDIEICLKDCKIAIDESILTFCNEILPKATALKSLALKLGFTSLSDRSLFALAKSLSPLSKNLETFNLGVENTAITDNGIEKIFDVILRVKALRLYLDGTGITDSSLKLLGEKKMPRMMNLEKFSLDVSETKITMEGVTAIFKGVPKDIKKLSLSFEGVNLLDEVISLFKEKVCPKLEVVENVHLWLEGRELREEASRLLEIIKKEAEERRKSRECKQESSY